MVKYFEKLVMNPENGEPIFHIFIDNKLTKTETPLERGLFRQKEFYIVFKRVALNPQTMQNISAWFIQKIVYKVPNKDGLDYHWFYFEKGMSLPCVRILDVRLGRLQGLTYQVNVNDAIFVRKVNQPKRITLTQKVKALMAMEYEGIPVLGQFSESDGSEFVSPKSE